MALLGFEIWLSIYDKWYEQATSSFVSHNRAIRCEQLSSSQLLTWEVQSKAPEQKGDKSYDPLLNPVFDMAFKLSLPLHFLIRTNWLLIQEQTSQ